MQKEEQTEASERYLLGMEYFTNNAIAIWQTECIKRCKNKPKDDVYHKYVNWVKRENEIAVFTLYAYADFKIPKKFDIIFQIDEPENYVKEEYELTQIVYEAWYPMDGPEHGHKHLCIFKFENRIPAILELLHKQDEKFSTITDEQKQLGFCSSADFEEIKQREKKNNESNY